MNDPRSRAKSLRLGRIATREHSSVGRALPLQIAHPHYLACLRVLPGALLSGDPRHVVTLHDPLCLAVIGSPLAQLLSRRRR